MSNMSYCRFQNTEQDLRDCKEHLTEVLPEDENEARKRLVGTCARILMELGVILPDDPDMIVLVVEQALKDNVEMEDTSDLEEEAREELERSRG